MISRMVLFFVAPQVAFSSGSSAGQASGFFVPGSAYWLSAARHIAARHIAARHIAARLFASWLLSGLLATRLSPQQRQLASINPTLLPGLRRPGLRRPGLRRPDLCRPDLCRPSLCRQRPVQEMLHQRNIPSSGTPHEGLLIRETHQKSPLQAPSSALR